MFSITKKSILEKIEKEDEQLASILKSINQLYRMAGFKLSYINNMLRNYNVKRFFEYPVSPMKFLEKNREILNQLQQLIASEKKLKSDESYQKRIFKLEIQNVSEAIRLLKKIRRIIKTETRLFKTVNRWFKEYHRHSYKYPGQKMYSLLSELAKCVKEEVELLNIDSAKIAKVKQQIKRLDDRIREYRKLPHIKAKYYHASQFLFNLGDKLRPTDSSLGGRNNEVEKIFEDIRKEEFPGKPSRLNCVFVDDNPRALEGTGIVYAVEAKGKMLKTDQEYFTNASVSYKANSSIQIVKNFARLYWEGETNPSFSETLVEGEVIITGLADFEKVGDRIEVIAENLTDDDGEPIPKGSKGIIHSYNQFGSQVELFNIDLQDNRRVSLPPGTFKVIK